jgi:hypothetical protein
MAELGKIVCLDGYRRRRAQDRLAASRLAVPEAIAPRIPTQRLEAMVDAVTRYTREHDRYWAPAPGSNG